MLRKIFKKIFNVNWGNVKPSPTRRPKPQLLQFEDRITPSTFTVTNTGDSNTVGSGSLRAAINLANATAGNDIINFNLTGASSYTIALTSGTALPTILDTNGGTLNIIGLGASVLNISGNNGVSTRNFNIFNIASVGNLNISGVTVSGAITTSVYGGAFNNSGYLTVTNSTITGNQAAYQGGGIFNNISGTLSVSNSTISGNTANLGGGIYNQGSLNISNTTIASNLAFTQGGGILNNGGSLSVSNSTITGNTSNLGGGINNSGILTVTNSTISGNSSGGSGGGGGGGGGGIYNSGT